MIGNVVSQPVTKFRVGLGGKTGSWSDRNEIGLDRQQGWGQIGFVNLWWGWGQGWRWGWGRGWRWGWGRNRVEANPKKASRLGSPGVVVGVELGIGSCRMRLGWPKTDAGVSLRWGRDRGHSRLELRLASTSDQEHGWLTPTNPVPSSIPISVLNQHRPCPTLTMSLSPT